MSDLSLKIQGTILETLIQELYQELEKAGISFKPKTYLSDEWGCPHGIPVIGIPFYLANHELSKLEGELTGIEAEDEEEVMMYLRHETGHAFNYAYRLYRKPEWRQLFGKFSQPYHDDYQPVPFSTKFVRHLSGWYAQKHPDEDFAETFAIWLTPGSDWQKRYADTPALAKLLYIDKIVCKYGHRPPVVTDDKQDMPVQELTMTLNSWYKTDIDANHISLNLHRTLNNDLCKLFPAKQGQPAADIFRAHSKQLIRDVNHWTGINRKLIVSS
ncbi:MAG: putative zinc-binding metallopeptidase [Chloroflexi bacterium]|nr:putative zinc-binding metallopeptidase [Chloroflexota bacterium]